MSTLKKYWTIAQVAEYLGATSTRSASRTLSRWGVKAAEHRVDERGRAHAMFSADLVRAAHEGRPGQGARTDLRSNRTLPRLGDLYRTWQLAFEWKNASPDSDAKYFAEQRAWDEFRDECDIQFPDGTCPHPECPQSKRGAR